MNIFQFLSPAILAFVWHLSVDQIFKDNYPRPMIAQKGVFAIVPFLCICIYLDTAFSNIYYYSIRFVVLYVLGAFCTVNFCIANNATDRLAITIQNHLPTSLRNSISTMFSRRSLTKRVNANNSNTRSGVAPQNTTPILDRPIPIHKRTTPANPQTQSPLFSLIPPEIRNFIFSYALAENEKTDPSSTYPEHISRPGYTSKRIINTTLLQTCRCIYLEVYQLPITNREHVFWHSPSRGPYGARFQSHADLAHENWYFNLMTSWQLALVKEVHLFTQMYWLEDQFQYLCKQSYVSAVEKLKITIRRGDWWWNESNHPLFISPRQRQNLLAGMQRDLANVTTGGNANEAIAMSWDPAAWGSAFKDLPSLKQLKMEFETSADDKRQELGQIVEWAKTWRFPMAKGYVLSIDEKSVKSHEWQGNMTHWSDQCPYCGVRNLFDENGFSLSGMCEHAGTDAHKPACVKRAEDMRQRRGPTLLVWNLTWRLVKGE